jgi:hypothetical protein
MWNGIDEYRLIGNQIAGTFKFRKGLMGGNGFFQNLLGLNILRRR